MKYNILFIFLIAFSFASKAQQGLSFSLNYEIPQGELAYVYKPTMSYTFSYVNAYNNTTANFSLGYYTFQPKQETFYYIYDENNYGTTTYSDFTLIPLSIGGAYKISLSDKLDLLPGIELGYCFILFGGGFETTKGIMSPKLGLSYKLNKKISLNIQSKYNALLTIGDLTFDDSSDMPGIGKFNTTWSNGLSLIYNF